jgi:hypothetical protein
LKNECDEDFIGIQKEVKLTIQNLFRVALKAKFPNKKNEELNRILEEKFKGMVTQEECIQILRYIYKDEDFNDINEKLERSLLLVESKTTSG